MKCVKATVTVIGEDEVHEYSLNSAKDIGLDKDNTIWSLIDIHGKEAHFPAAAVYVEVG